MKPITDAEWAHLHSLIANISPILKQHREDLTGLASELATLETNRCTGKAHWRDLKDSYKKPKLYIIHATSTPCPIHGKPLTGARIRTYVGTNPAKKQQAISAMQRNETYKRLQTDYDNLDGRIRRLIYLVSRIYWTLNLPVPEASEDDDALESANGPGHASNPLDIHPRR